MVDSIVSSIPINRFNFTKSELLSYFENSWRLTEILFSSIKDKATLFIAPDPYRYPLIFYYGHAAAFYINIFIRSGLITKRINNGFEQLFAEGVDPSSPEELNREIIWPDYEEVESFRRSVYECVLNLIDALDINSITSDDPKWAILMAVDHERIHFETSSVLIKQYDHTYLQKPVEWLYAPSSSKYVNNEMILVPKGSVVLGKPDGHPNFGWDNEYGFLFQDVNYFYASKNLVTNAEFINFLEDKGYEQKKFWSEEGWIWKNKYGVNKPRFWDYSGRQYFYRAMFDLFIMPKDWPVEVNFFEAEAYCNWRGGGSRLMTEFEFERLAKFCGNDKEPFFNEYSNINFRFGSSCSVDYFESNNAKLFNDVYGNVFQWLSTPFYSLPGFRTHYLYQHFSYPFFGKNHAMLKGGSWASTGASSSKYYRLWFRKNMYQHAGFRVAMNVKL